MEIKYFKFITDKSTIIYAIESIVFTYGFILFLWWWIKNKKATTVFSYVTLLFTGLAIKTYTNLYARFLRFSADYERFVEFTTSNIWFFREVLVILAATFIVGRMSWRAFYIRPRLMKKYREEFEKLNNGGDI